MMTLLCDYWPLLLLLPGLGMALWAIGWVEWHRGYMAGRAAVHREMSTARKGRRI